CANHSSSWRPSATPRPKPTLSQSRTTTALSREPSPFQMVSAGATAFPRPRPRLSKTSVAEAPSSSRPATVRATMLSEPERRLTTPSGSTVSPLDRMAFLLPGAPVGPAAGIKRHDLFSGSNKLKQKFE
ncbi:hypothetical protein K457DRAFT_1889753, partial [Linnemannia elongata AG-77]